MQGISLAQFLLSPRQLPREMGDLLLMLLDDLLLGQELLIPFEDLSLAGSEFRLALAQLDTELRQIPALPPHRGLEPGHLQLASMDFLLVPRHFKERGLMDPLQAGVLFHKPLQGGIQL